MCLIGRFFLASYNFSSFSLAKLQMGESEKLDHGVRSAALRNAGIFQRPPALFLGRWP